MLCVDGSSLSSYLKDFILHVCFLRHWWTVINFYCLFIPRSRLRLKFQDHCEYGDLVRNWLFWLERVFKAYWGFEGSCWNLSRFCVGRQSIRVFKCLENSQCFFAIRFRTPTWVCGLSMVVVVLGYSLLLLRLYWIVGFFFCGFLGHVIAP